jgi:hypothetical protein
VQPSNYKIKVTGADKITFETYAIRVVSDYIEGFNEENSMPRFYYISQNNELIAITNSDLIKELQDLDDVNWMDNMPLANIITESPKNKCNYPPNMDNKSVNDINAPCSHHDKNKIFAYNLNSYPCCFNKEPDARLLSKKKKENVITTKHILISDKMLDNQRIGFLPDNLDKVFNQLVKHESPYKFYRMGVVQNSSSFLNAILLACNNTIQGIHLTTSKEFRKMLADYIKSNPLLYTQLNGGDISLKYKKVENYVNYIMDTNETIYWEDIIDVVQRVISNNILLIDIPYNSNREPDYKGTRLICTPFLKMDKNLPCLILIKRNDVYELVFQLIELEQTQSLFQFKYNDNGSAKTNIINFLFEYQGISCVRENTFPNGYVYDEMYLIDDYINLLHDTTHAIISQVMNKFKKVVYVITKRGILIPVKESGAIDSLKIVSLSQLRSKDKLWDLKTFQHGIQELNEFLTTKIKILGVSVDKTFYTAALTNFGQFVPLKRTPIQIEFGTIPVLNYKYYENVDDILAKSIEGDDMQTQYTKSMQDIKRVIHQIKTDIAEKVSNDELLKNEIIHINTSVSLTRPQKLQKLEQIFTKLIDVQGYDFYEYHVGLVLQQIANEIMNDNVENLLLNNIVISDVFDPNVITKRDQESILFNISDIEKWFARYERK